MTLPIDKFGIDHWSTFAYIETCCVDYQGKVDPRRMRSEGGKYPSRLKSGETLAGHSDWDCALDLEAAGLLKRIETQVFKLTRKGWGVASKLRQHRARHNTFGGFLE
jgi:hypothetical protein